MTRPTAQPVSRTKWAPQGDTPKMKRPSLIFKDKSHHSFLEAEEANIQLLSYFFLDNQKLCSLYET